MEIKACNKTDAHHRLAHNQWLPFFCSNALKCTTSSYYLDACMLLNKPTTHPCRLTEKEKLTDDNCHHALPSCSLHACGKHLVRVSMIKFTLSHCLLFYMKILCQSHSHKQINHNHGNRGGAFSSCSTRILECLYLFFLLALATIWKREASSVMPC